MDGSRSVLIVDRSEETRGVLRAALERLGTRVWEAGAAAEGLELARRHHPDLIVLDLEIETTPNDVLPGQFAQQTRADASSLIVLGTARCTARHVPHSEFVPKPYHYAPLIRKIEELLALRLGERSA